MPLGNRPAYPGKRPPYKPNVRCIDNERPNLNGPASARTDTSVAAASLANAVRRGNDRKRPEPTSEGHTRLRGAP